MDKGGGSRLRSGIFERRHASSECRCRDADARTLRGRNERTNELAWCMMAGRERDWYEGKKETAGFGWWIRRCRRAKERGPQRERERERERVQRKKKSCATPLAGDQTPRRTVHGVTDEERLSNAPPTLPAREKHLSTFEKGCGEAISRHRGPLTF